MKGLIPILIGLLVVGCGNKTSKPEAKAKPMVTLAVDIREKIAIPNASPVSPNANKQSGNPMPRAIQNIDLGKIQE